jgi:hypothetical protein
MLVLCVAWYLYFKPSLQLSAQASSAGLSVLNRTWVVSYDVQKRFDPTRLCIALISGMLVWLAVGTAGLLAQSIRWPLVHDAPIMHYVAWRISQGAVPYREIVDMNMPGVYLIHLAVLKVVGPSDLGWRAFDLLWLSVTNVLLWRLCHPIAGKWSIIAVLLYSAFHLSSGPPGMGQRDFLEFTCLLAGLLLAVEALDHKLETRRLAAAGLLLGCAMTIKPIAALLWIALAGWLFFSARERTRSRWTYLCVILGSGLVVPVALGGWLAAIGGLNSFVDTLLGVMPAYSRMHDRQFLSYVWEYWPLLVPCVLTIPLAASVGRTTRGTTLILGVLYGVLHYSLQNKGWLYQLYPLIGFASALLAYTVGAAIKSGSRKQVLAASTVTIGLIVSLGAWDGRFRPAMALTADRIGTVSALQQDMGPRIAAGATIQVFDTTGGCLHALFRMKTPQATKYLGDYLMFDQLDQPYVQKLRSGLMADIRLQPPAYLIVYRWGWPSGQYERLQRFPELQQYIAESYHVETIRNQYVLYARNLARKR